MKAIGPTPLSQRRLLLAASLSMLGILSPLPAQNYSVRQQRNDLRTDWFTGKWKTSIIATSAGYTLRTVRLALFATEQPRSHAHHTRALILSLDLFSFLPSGNIRPAPPPFEFSPIENINRNQKHHPSVRKKPFTTSFPTLNEK